ncbi:MAG: asparaginase [Pseudomonadota bacterium]
MAARDSTETVNPVLAEIWRGPVLESVHRGTAIVCRPSGEVIAAWGDPERVILPRSACKMLQALPLVESGAAAGLGSQHLAIACASHQGAEIHSSLVGRWLAELGLGEGDLRCGPQLPNDGDARHALRIAGHAPDQTHNNCSGKHCGFLTLGAHLGAGPDYIDPAHPVQESVRLALSEMAQEDLTQHAIDGCSAPNYAMTIRGLATAAARFAMPATLGPTRGAAAERLAEAMVANPMLVAGAGRACTDLITACAGRAVVKTGAEGVFVGILREAGLGIAIKCDDGAGRGSEAAIAALLTRFGALEPGHPSHARYADTPLTNRRGIVHGHLRAGPALSAR